MYKSVRLLLTEHIYRSVRLLLAEHMIGVRLLLAEQYQLCSAESNRTGKKTCDCGELQVRDKGRELRGEEGGYERMERLQR